MKKKILIFNILCILSFFSISAQKIGEEREVTAISHLGANASWDGCSAKSDENTAIYNPPPGWAIVEYNTVTHSQSNGSSSVSVIGKDINFVSLTEWTKSFDDLIDLAAKINNQEAKANLQQKKSEYEKFYTHIKSNMNTIQAIAKAKAHGTCYDRKRGWSEISVIAKLVFIGTDSDLKREIADLKTKYSLEK